MVIQVKNVASLKSFPISGCDLIVEGKPIFGNQWLVHFLLLFKS